MTSIEETKEEKAPDTEKIESEIEGTSNGLEDKQNGETIEGEDDEIPQEKENTAENADATEKVENTPVDSNKNETEVIETKPNSPTRASKRKLTEIESEGSGDVSKSDITEEVKIKTEENPDDDSGGFQGFPTTPLPLSFDTHFMDTSSNDKDNPPKSIPESDIMGKGKRARIPNKRYSEIALTNSRKSLGAGKSSDMDATEEVIIKEEPLDEPSISSPPLSQPPAPKKSRTSSAGPDLQDPKYLKPFKYGWRRELVWRGTSSNEKRMGDIYYYTPTGKKARSMREVSELIDNRLLTLDNFTYTKVSLGVNDTSKETIRHAKPINQSKSDSPAVKANLKTTAVKNTGSPLVKNVVKAAAKKVMSPKLNSPKVLSPRIASAKVETPKSPARIKKEKETPSSNTPGKKKKVVLIKKTPLRTADSGKTPAKDSTPKSTPAAKEKEAAKTPSNATKPGRKGRSAATPTPKTDESMEVDSSPPPVRLSPLKTNKPYQPCSIRCEGVQGIIPTLQCRTCLCLYHYECVGVSQNSIAPYVCKNCQDEQTDEDIEDEPPPLISPPPLTPINTLITVTGSVSTVLPRLQRIPRADGGDTPPIQMQPPVLSPVNVLPEMPKLTPRPLPSLVQTAQAEMPQLHASIPLMPELQIIPAVPQLYAPIPLPPAPVSQLKVALTKLQPAPMPQLKVPLTRMELPTPMPTVTTAQVPPDTTVTAVPHVPKTTTVTQAVSQAPTHVSRPQPLTTSASQVLVPQSSQAVLPEGSKSLVGSVTSWLPHNVKIVSSSESTEILRPQYLEYINGRKFLVIPKHNLMTVTPSSTRSEDDTVVPSDIHPTDLPAPDSASMGPSAVLPEIKTEPPDSPKGDSSPLPQQPGQDSADTALDDEIARINNFNKKKNLRGRKANPLTNSNSTNHFDDKPEAKFMENYLQNLSFGYNTLLYVFQYLKVQDLLRAGCVCTMWRDIASHPILWKTVRMKNSQVHSFEGLANTLKSHGTVNLDLRKMLLPNNGDEIWPEFSKAIEKVDTLRKIELCRCPASVVERLAVTNPKLEVINAVTIKCEVMELDTLENLISIKELRLKATNGLNISSIGALRELKTLKVLSLTSVNELHRLNLNVLGELTNLEQLDLGECTEFPKNFGKDILSKLKNLERLRLEKGQGVCHTFDILDAVKNMPKLEQLELVNFDVKSGFDKALGACTNIKKLMIIPTYISQSATTNNMVLSGVLRLQGSLSHFVWGVTLELLRVTELFVDQCEEPKEKKEKKPTGNGDSIPVLKPVPDLTHSKEIPVACNPPQVEILPLPNLQKLLLNSLPTTRVKILKIPFHATWRQTLTDSV